MRDILQYTTFGDTTKKILSIILFSQIIFSFLSCRKLLEIDTPPTNISLLNVYERDATAIGAVTAIYTRMSSGGMQGENVASINFLAALSADELNLNVESGNLSAIHILYHSNNLNGQTVGYEFWNNIYPDLYLANAALEGITRSNSLTPAVKAQLLGETRFMRAFYLFYLVNLYGDVPLTITTDYKINALMPRSPSEAVWQQIISDLKIAQSLLNESFLDATLLKTTSERVRPTKGAATALLARVYLYTQDWSNAEKQATVLINNPNYSLVGLNDAFKKNNMEAIWQLQPVSITQRTKEAEIFIPNSDDTIEPDVSNCPAFLSDLLLNDFEDGDMRKTYWTNKIVFNKTILTYAFKYKNRLNADIADEYSTVFRLAEQYLIRAEARIHQSLISEAVLDLNILRTRATNNTIGSKKLSQLPSSLSKSSALISVEHERRVELFTEWGHRWLDLKRTGRVDDVMLNAVPKKEAGAVWKSFQQWYPIDIKQISLNPNLVQITGY